MSTNQVNSKYVGIRQERGAVWLTHHGRDEKHSVSHGLFPAHGTVANLYRQIVDGTVLGKCPDGLHRPLAADSAQEAVVTANVIPVADPLQFCIGQMVELPTSVLEGADRFRKVTEIDYDNLTITVDGATFSLDEGDLIEVDPTRGFGNVKTTAAASGTATTLIALEDGDAAEFPVGSYVTVGATTQEIATTTLTFDDGITAIVGLRVIDRNTGELITETEVEHAMATDAATSVEAIKDKLNAELPAATAVVTRSGDDLVVTTEEDDYRVELSLGFGDGNVDTGAWTEVAYSAYSGSGEPLLVTARVLTAGSNSITVAGDIAVTEDELVVSEPGGVYKISCKTVTIDEWEYTPDNVLVPYMPHGRVKEALVIGLTATAKAALAPMIMFDQRTIA